LGGFLIAPETGIGGAGFEGFQALAMLRGVKENSEPWRGGASGIRSGIGGLRESWVGCEEDKFFGSEKHGPQRLKPVERRPVTARLKPCPDVARQI
jgi:hypothetical protein